MIKLIDFELKKIIYSKSFIVILIFIILISFLTVFFTNKVEFNDKYNYIENEKIMSKNEYKEVYPKYNYDNYIKQVKNKNKLTKENNLKYDYSLKHKTNYLNKSKNTLEYTFTLVMFLALIIIIISGQMMSKEYSKKTINRILLLPYKRYKLFHSKLITLLIICFVYCILLLLMMFLFTLVFNGSSELFTPSLEVINNKVKEVSYLMLFLKQYFILLIPILFIIILAYSLSTITKNTAVSVSVSLFINISALVLATFLLSINVSLVEYTFLPYLDFTIFNDKLNIVNFNIENNCNLSILKATCILLIYAIIIYIPTTFIFTKKDVTC